MGRTHSETIDSAFPEWRELLGACQDYALLSGWRFVLSDFMNLSERQHEPGGLSEARERAMPTALAYGDRVRACVEAAAAGATPPRLVEEFVACQRLVSQEAVFNSMVATIAAVGLAGTDGDGASSAAAGSGDEADALSYHDMSQPIEVIARRLTAYQKHMRDTGTLDERRTRLLHASFIVEFGLEHGLPERRDATSEATLNDFMTRLGEWEGARREGATGELVRSLVLDAIPEGPAKRPLKRVVFDWAYEHKAQALIGGALLGGLLGIAVAGLTVAAAGRARGGR